MVEVYQLKKKNESWIEGFIKKTNRIVGGSIGCAAGFWGSVAFGAGTAGLEQMLYHGISPEVLQSATYAALHYSPIASIVGTGVGLLCANEINYWLLGKR